MHQNRNPAQPQPAGSHTKPDPTRGPRFTFNAGPLVAAVFTVLAKHFGWI